MRKQTLFIIWMHLLIYKKIIKDLYIEILIHVNITLKLRNLVIDTSINYIRDINQISFWIRSRGESHNYQPNRVMKGRVSKIIVIEGLMINFLSHSFIKLYSEIKTI